LRPWGPLTPITPNSLFYSVTKNVVDPAIERSVWRLEIGGHVNAPRSYSFTDLGALASAV
jgi:DMSO/TMAO reductase YedYZ molybdopterin-dependent catalytic subunit